MLKNRKTVIGVGLVLVLTAIFVYAGFKVSSIFGNEPVFKSSGRGIGDVWAYEFVYQPIFLGAYDSDGGVFAKTVYFKGSRPIIVELWLAGTWEDKNIAPVKFIFEGKVTEIKRAADLNKFGIWGKRLKVEYLTGETVTGHEVVSDNPVCQRTPRICQVYEIVKSDESKYVDFKNSGVLSADVKLPALYLNVELER